MKSKATSFAHQFQLRYLDNHDSLGDKTSYIYQVVNQHFPCIDRLAIAKYDQDADTLRTAVEGSRGDNPLSLYETKLSKVPSLLKLVKNRETRIINDLSTLAASKSTHSQRIVGKGFLSSYTVPLFNNNQFIGMLFFNSYQREAFNESNLTYLDMIAHLLTTLLAADLNRTAILRGALNTATQFTHHRDPETGMHLERMSRYSRLIALKLGPAHMIDDEFADKILQHAPLHDVGKSPSPTGYC